MPVTETMFKKFHGALGQEITDELVNALNAADHSHRDEFRGFLETRFGRLETRMDNFETRMDKLETRMDKLETRMDKLETRMDKLETGMELLRADLRGELKHLDSRMDVKLEALKAELLKWMFLFWVGTMGTVLAIMKL